MECSEFRAFFWAFSQSPTIPPTEDRGLWLRDCRGKNEASVPVFYADWTSVPVPRTSSLRELDVGFIPLLPKELPYMANNDEYTDEYNDEYLGRDFFVGFNFWSRLSFQISEFRVHWLQVVDLTSLLQIVNKLQELKRMRSQVTKTLN